MERVVKIIAVAFIVAILVAIGITMTLPKDRLTLEEELKVQESIKELNRDLPRPFGTIGSLDSISFHKRKVGYHISIFGDPSISAIYHDRYHDFHDVFLYSLATLDGQNGNATTLAEYCKAKKIGMTTSVVFSDNEPITWEFAPSELFEFIHSYNGTPTEALGRVLDFHIALANYNCSSITTNSVSFLSDEGIALRSLEHLDDSIVWNWIVDENKHDVGMLSSSFQNEGFADTLIGEIIKDPDVQELINIISISHADIILRYKGLNSNNTAEITLPYHLIKRYSQVPGLH